MRVKIDWRSGSKENYNDFCKKHPNIILTFNDWKDIVYSFNESFRDYILETGEKAKLPAGFGEFSIVKKKRKKIKVIKGVEYINLPIDWQKTKEKGKKIYNFNHHTEGYFFGWKWFKQTTMIKFPDLWYFKACRETSRLIKTYVTKDEKYQHIYKEWNIN